MRAIAAVNRRPERPRSLLAALVGDIRLAQVELALDPAPHLVGELAAAIELIDPLPLGIDQREQISS
jgi:hypothetical protein